MRTEGIQISNTHMMRSIRRSEGQPEGDTSDTNNTPLDSFYDPRQA